MKNLKRQTTPDPFQLALPLDEFDSAPVIDRAGSTPAEPIQTRLQPDSNSTPPSTTLTPGKRRIQIDGHTLDYLLKRSRRRTIGFVIDDDGLRVIASKSVAIAEIERAIHNKKRWIFAKLVDYRQRTEQRLQLKMEWRDGATLPYLGEAITLRIGNHSSGIDYRAATRELAISLPAGFSEQQLKDRVQAWLQAEAKRVFAARLPLYASKLDVRYRAFALSSAATQWGSCNANGNIRLNWRLIHFKLEVIDYVIAHELAHLREMNHSPRFWAVVQSVFPEFVAARQALRGQAVERLPVF